MYLETVDVPVTWSPQEAVGIIKESGAVGCGGAGFPTYVKYQNPKPTLLVNAAESEPGYYADKLLLRDHGKELAALMELFHDLLGIDRFVIGAEDVAAPYLGELEAMAEDTGHFEVRYFPSEYKFGQERALCREVLGIPVGPKERPDERGVVVNNNETLHNVHRALFEDHPVTTKFVHVYGEAAPCRVYEAPIGTLASDLLELHGTPVADVADCHVYDGGPILATRVMERADADPAYPVHKTTNAILVVRPDRDRPRKKWYPHEDHATNCVDCACAPDRIEKVEDRVDRVRVPRDVAFGEPARLHVAEGEWVEAGDELGAPTEGLSVGIHASIRGEVTAITDDHVEIQR